MLEVTIAVVFALAAFYLAEKDNEDGELYKILHRKE
jgi:hypothetical protein